MRDVNELVDVVVFWVSPLVIEHVVVEGGRIMVLARTPDGVAACPGCGAGSARVHGCHERTVADVPWKAACGGPGARAPSGVLHARLPSLLP
ncbi:hypothetical protein QFZ82_007467 [Streptomyces sp. V4I23]|uniref:hypothetical protein n=1 Tax=Streptomyces sp. V4I23 TaxID=3042282 RepID=UPI0027886453|nr:hypothetical protein [Streptomyces sp. V4I23]